MEKVNKNMCHISSIKRENKEAAGCFTFSSCETTARKCTKKCAAIRPIVVFHSSGQGHPTTVFCKMSVRRSKFCLEFSFTGLKISRWPFHSCTTFEAHLIMLISSLRYCQYPWCLKYTRVTTSESSPKYDLSIILTSLLHHFIEIKLFNRKEVISGHWIIKQELGGCLLSPRAGPGQGGTGGIV